MKIPAEIIAGALREGRSSLLEHEAKELVRAQGITVPRSEVVGPDDHQAILAAAEKLGYPVALKAVSAEILHKTDSGAVMLNIASSAALAASIPAMKNMIAARTPGAVIRFFLLEKMMPTGLELLIGGLRDAQFGPSVSFGLGGVWVEALQDAVFGILPMTRQELLKMIAETKAGAFIQGFRGSAPLDREAALTTINAVSSLLTTHPEIVEIDLNPVLLYARSAVTLDARIVLRK
jgi:acetyl-CoA synthetase (ADP-forming)